MKYPLILLFAALICSCANQHGRPENKPTASPQELSDTARKLSLLLSIPDSFPAYIKLNKQLYDSLSAHNMPGETYLYNITGQHERAAKDTALIKILGRAYWALGGKKFDFTYNETMVKNLEQLVLLEKNNPQVYYYLLYACNNLGISYNVLGDLKKSAYYYAEGSSDALTHGNYDGYSSLLINTTIALNELGLYDSTIHLIENALGLKGIARKRLAGLYTNLATAQSKTRRFEEAIVNARKSLDIITKLDPAEIDGEIKNKKYQCYWNLGEIQSFSGNDADAAVTLDTALRLAFLAHDSSFKGREAGKIFIARGRIAERMGKPQEGLLYYQKALATVTNVDSNNISALPPEDSLYRENTIMEALDAKANLLQKLYGAGSNIQQLILAVRCYELAFEVENKLMQNFSYDESLARQAKESRARSEQAITACYKLYMLTKQQNWAESAFVFAEKSKAVVLLESIRKNIAANNTSQNDTLLQKVQLFQQQVAYFEKLLYKANDTAEITKLTAKKYNAETALLAAKTKLMHSNSGYREALLKPGSFSVSLLKEKLTGKTTAIIEFFEGKTNTWAFIISKGLPVQFVQYGAGPGMLTDSLLHYFTNASFISNDPAGFQQSAYRVYNALQWEQMDKNWRRLVIIPDGRFSFLPFDALITRPSVAMDLQKAPYLIHEREIMYAYSAAILVKQVEQSSHSSKGLSAFAPGFLDHERKLLPIPNTTNEIKNILRYRKGDLFIGGNATLSNFKTAAGNSGILHIATHAYADTGAIIIPRIEFIDSSLLLNELYALQTKASLVVLSACETGIGQVNKSEGPISLARGFYYAGARNVITSYWNVDDKSTAELFADFYRNIDNDTYSAALHRAKLRYIENASAESASPYYWAGFVHFGYPQPEGSNKKWWLLLAPALLIAFGIQRSKKIKSFKEGNNH